MDAESNIDVCLETLNDLNDRLTDCSNLANDYRSHQKTFKVEMTRFEILEQVVNEVKLRILLWDSLATWDQTVAEWYEVDFETLNVEEITSFVMKNLKNIVQLEKGLPANNILPALKGIVVWLIFRNSKCVFIEHKYYTAGYRFCALGFPDLYYFEKSFAFE